MNIICAHCRALTFASLLIVAVSIGQAADAVRVVPNHKVSGDAPDQEYEEVWITSNPQNDLELAACGIGLPVSASHYVARTAVYRSNDGGGSLHRAFEVRGLDQASDPTCEFSHGRTLHFPTLRLR